VQEVSSGVFITTEFRRVTVGALLTAEGFVLIDTPPYPDDALRWREQLFQLSNKPVLAIINTDYHRDRVLGNCWFDSKVIIAHDDTIAQMRNLPAAFLDSAIESLIADTGERGNFVGVQLQAPSVGFSRRMQIRYGGRSIPLLAMPGPTTGNLWVHLPEERIVFVGDSVLADQAPYISSPCTKSWLDNLTILRRDRFPADILIPGRGVLTDKSATDPISNYLRVARRRVLSLYRAGRPRADTTTIVPELLELFPYEEEDLERIQRRIKAGLDRIYEEYKLNDHMPPK